MLLAVSVSAQVDLYNGLIAYYPFDGNANDGSGNGQNGTVTGAVLQNDRFGNNSASYYFSSAASHKIEAIAGNSLQLGTSDFTVVLWVKHATSAQNIAYSFLGLTSITEDTSIYIFQKKEFVIPPVGPPLESYKAFNCQFLNFGSSNQTISSPVLQPTDINPYADGNWHMVVGKREGSVFSMRIDSVEYTTTINSNMSLSVNKIWIGTDKGIYYTDGNIDDVMIYNRALSGQEVDSIYNLTATIASVTPSSVINSSVNNSNIYPNPILNTATIQFVEIGIYNVQVFDLKGKLVYSVKTQDQDTQINFTNWSSGIYTVKITDSKGKTEVKKIVKK